MIELWITAFGMLKNMTCSKILFFCLISFIGGVFLCSFLNIPKLIICELFVLGIFYGLFFFRQKTIFVFGLCLITLGLGVVRTDAVKSGENGFLLSSPGEEIVKSDGHQTSAGLKIEERFLPLKQRLRDIVEQSFSPPHSSILAALLLGAQQYIPKEWKEKLNITGVRHITAISGMHIVILSGILLWLGIIIGLYRGQAFYFALFALWFFIFLTGVQPSAVRAGIMGSMFLFCQKIGCQGASHRALFLAAAAMLTFNPLLLKEIGFQLSFLASMGIIYLMPLFQRTLAKLKLLKTFGIDELLSMTFAAQIFTLPILVYNFGSISLVSPLTNILIVPVLPYLMAGGLFFLFFGFIWQPLSFVFSLSVWLLLNYLLWVVALCAKIPFASFALQISWPWLFIAYSLLAYWVYRFSKKEKEKFPVFRAMSRAT